MTSFSPEVRDWFVLTLSYHEGKCKKLIEIKISVGCNVWFSQDCVFCNIEHLPNIDEIWPIRYLTDRPEYFSLKGNKTFGNLECLRKLKIYQIMEKSNKYFLKTFLRKNSSFLKTFPWKKAIFSKATVARILCRSITIVGLFIHER